MLPAASTAYPTTDPEKVPPLAAPPQAPAPAPLPPLPLPLLLPPPAATTDFDDDPADAAGDTPLSLRSDDGGGTSAGRLPSAVQLESPLAPPPPGLVLAPAASVAPGTAAAAAAAGAGGGGGGATSDATPRPASPPLLHSLLSRAAKLQPETPGRAVVVVVVVKGAPPAPKPPLGDTEVEVALEKSAKKGRGRGFHLTGSHAEAN